MTRVNNVDQVLLLLRAQLQRSERAKGTKHKPRAGRRELASAAPLDRVRALAVLDMLSPEDARRTLVRGVLADQFGDRLANDARFQEIVENVVSLLEADPEGRALLEGALTQLRAG